MTRRQSLLLVIALVWGMSGPLTAAQVSETDKSLVVDPAPDAAPGSKPPLKPDEKERRIKLTAGLAALAGIAILGIVFAAIIIIWAGRLRRMVREPIPPTGRQDPFWFLRPEKTVLPKETDEMDTPRS